MAVDDAPGLPDGTRRKLLPLTRERAIAIVVRLRREIRRLRDERLTRHVVATAEPVPDPPPVCRGRTDGGRVRGVRKAKR